LRSDIREGTSSGLDENRTVRKPGCVLPEFHVDVGEQLSPVKFRIPSRRDQRVLEVAVRETAGRREEEVGGLG
jgi:hypothetical protein